MNWARSFNANKISIAAAPTDQILPAANDRMAERGMDRISFDDTAPSQQEYRAAGTRGGGLPGRQHSALELGENEVPDLRRVIAVDQKLDHPIRTAVSFDVEDATKIPMATSNRTSTRLIAIGSFSCISPEDRGHNRIDCHRDGDQRRRRSLQGVRPQQEREGTTE